MKKILTFLDENFEKYISIFLFSAMIDLCMLQVFFRYVVNMSLAWTEELARYCFIASIYSAASYGIKKDEHIRVELLNSILPDKPRAAVRFLADVIWLLFSLYISCISIDMCQTFIRRGQTTPTLHLPTGYVYGIIPAAFILMSVRLIQKLFRDIRNHTMGRRKEGSEQ